MRESNLFLVTNPAINQPRDFEKIAAWIGRNNPHISVFMVPPVAVHLPPDPRFDRPTLIFSPGPAGRFRALRGKVFQGVPLPKSAELRALEDAGIPVPRWAMIKENQEVDLAEFTSYVVVKPDRGGRGADVSIVRRDRVRWKKAKTDFAKNLNGDGAWVAQDFIYTGSWPVSYRVTTLFGEVLWALRIEADRERRPLQRESGFSGKSVVSSGKGCRYSICDDPEIIALGMNAHAAFPDIPLLGVDILRDEQSGELYVIEVNAVGYTWHFSSPKGMSVQRQFSLNLESQFDGINKAARILSDAVDRLAG